MACACVGCGVCVPVMHVTAWRTGAACMHAYVTAWSAGLQWRGCTSGAPVIDTSVAQAMLGQVQMYQWWLRLVSPSTACACVGLLLMWDCWRPQQHALSASGDYVCGLGAPEHQGLATAVANCVVFAGCFGPKVLAPR